MPLSMAAAKYVRISACQVNNTNATCGDIVRFSCNVVDTGGYIQNVEYKIFDIWQTATLMVYGLMIPQ
jgi:NifU-like protein involved in Fe-S cluster formation